jgi:hemoglobin-like flavoprotein
MLNEKTIQIVKSTAPILQEHGETLTRHFYKRMFSHNPEVAPFFNPARTRMQENSNAPSRSHCRLCRQYRQSGSAGRCGRADCPKTRIPDDQT